LGALDITLLSLGRCVSISFRTLAIHLVHRLALSLSSCLPHVQTGRLSSGQKEKLEKLINQYPDVLNDKLGLTHIMEYEIKLLDNTPVRLTPYGLSTPKMQHLREHIKPLLRDGVMEP
jgi:hypothetical protein